jgi:hypothetical protein
MDPKTYLKNEREIVVNLMIAVDKFKVTQKERAERFVLIYKALDKFDPQKIFDEMRVMNTKSQVLSHLYTATEEFRSLYKDDDNMWIQHEKYNEEFFDSFLPGAICRFANYNSSRFDIAISFASFFRLKRRKIISDSEGD